MMIMSEAFIQKNVALSLEFDSYVVRHPELFEDIPNGATVVITLSGDSEFNAASISTVKRSRSRRPIVEARKSGRRWSVQPLAPVTA
jgi:hypothetical protein